MIENLSNKQKAYGTLAVFFLLALAFWYYSDIFSLWASTNNVWLVMIVSIILNPAYLFLIYTLYRQYNLRGLISGIFISLSVDIISLGHSVNRLGIMPTDPALFTYSDTTFYKFIYPILGGRFGVFFIYVILSVLLVYIALRIIRRNASFNKILKEAI